MNTSFPELEIKAVDPPGVFIRQELDARKWSQRDLAYILGMAETQLSRILAGAHAITPDMSRQLGDAFNVSPELFANLQKQFDLSKAKKPDPAIRKRAVLQGAFPLRDMIKRGWIQDDEPSLLDLQMRRFFEAESLDDVLSPGFAAKRTSYAEDTAGQVAWLFRVRQLARLIDAPPYSQERLSSALARLRPLLIDPDAVREVPEILRECGVRFVIVEALPNSKIDGVCTWLNDESPVIGLSTFYDRFDNFWFVLRHEIEHVLRGDGKVKSIIDSFENEESTDKDRHLPDEEVIANAASTTFSIPHDRLKSFYERKYPYISERDIVSFASVMQVHPAIVVGQIQKLMNRYNYLRKYLVPVRKHLLDHVVFDGWNHVAPASL